MINGKWKEKGDNFIIMDQF